MIFLIAYSVEIQNFEELNENYESNHCLLIFWVYIAIVDYRGRESAHDKDILIDWETAYFVVHTHNRSPSVSYVFVQSLPTVCLVIATPYLYTQIYTSISIFLGAFGEPAYTLCRLYLYIYIFKQCSNLESVYIVGYFDSVW